MERNLEPTFVNNDNIDLIWAGTGLKAIAALSHFMLTAVNDVGAEATEQPI